MKKNFFEKMVIILELFASVCTITGVSIWGIVTYINSEKVGNEYFFEVSENEEGTENIEENTIEKSMENSTENLFMDAVDNTENINYSSNIEVQDEKSIEMIDVESEVKRIRSDYNSAQNQKSDPLQHPLNKDIKLYYIEDNLASIEIINGYNDINYSRIYYFDKDGKLYFAFVFDKKKENRLYFKDDILIRYIDENGEIYNLYENLESCIWSDLVLSESYELLENAN